MRTLLPRRIDIDVKNGHGYNALMIAAHEDRVEIVQALLDAGANARLRNKKRETAVDIAKLGGHERISQALNRAPVR